MAITVIKSSHFMGWTCEKNVKLLASGSSRMACWRILPFTSGISQLAMWQPCPCGSPAPVAALPLWQPCPCGSCILSMLGLLFRQLCLSKKNGYLRNPQQIPSGYLT